MHCDIIVGHNTFYLDIFGLRQFRCHLKIQYVTSIVLDDMQHARAAIDSTSCGKHLIRHRRGKDCSRTGSIEHATTDKAAVHRLVTTAPT